MSAVLKLELQAPERAPGKLFENESMYSLACRHGMYSTSTRLPISIGISVLDSRATANPQLPEALGVSAEWLHRACGADLPALARKVERTWLRYCPYCIAGGYHSPVYQSTLLLRCPVHGAQLLDQCHQCGERIVPTRVVTELAPFECPHCLCDLRRCERYTCSDAEVAQAEAAVSLIRQAVSWDGDERFRPLRPLIVADGRVRVPAARVTRSLQRALVFSRPPGAAMPAFREREVCVLVEEHRSESSTWEAQLKFMKWARNQRLPQCAVVQLCKRARQGTLEEVQDRAVPLVAAAMFAVLRCYRLEDTYLSVARGCSPDPPARPVRFSTSCDQSPQLNALLMRLELQGALATTIAAVVRNRGKEPMRWPRLAPAHEYCPSAVLDLDSQRARVRCRAEEDKLAALIRRYSKLLVRIIDAGFLDSRETAPGELGSG